MIGSLPTRAKHLAWCKKRALQYLETDNTKNAFASMMSDLGKHPETRDHMGCQLGAMMLFSGLLDTTADMRKWIEGFN